jgi:hypothetical protein
MSYKLREYRPNLKNYNSNDFADNPLSITLTSFVGGKELGKAVQMTFSCPDCLTYSYFHLSEKQIKDLIKVLQKRLENGGDTIKFKTMYQNGKQINENI